MKSEQQKTPRPRWAVPTEALQQARQRQQENADCPTTSKRQRKNALRLVQELDSAIQQHELHNNAESAG